MSRIRRVILAQDLASRDPQATRTAVALAARLGAGVLGLFLEDPRLLRWADLPVARQVSAWGVVAEQAQLEAQLRALAAQAQTELESAARRLGVPWSARVLRGALQDLAEAAADDLWVIGTAGQLMGLEVPTFALLRPTLPPAARLILLRPRTQGFQRPLVVLHESSSRVEAVLDAAWGLMESPTQPLSVLMIGDRAELATQVQAWQARRNALLRPVHLGQAGIAELAQVCAQVGCDGLVVAADWSWLEGEGLERLLAVVRTPVLVVQ